VKKYLYAEARHALPRHFRQILNSELYDLSDQSGHDHQVVQNTAGNVCEIGTSSVLPTLVNIFRLEWPKIFAAD
jgi:hypothetical protein